MRKIPKPTFNIITVYQDCISKVNDATLKARLSAIQGIIHTSTIAFEAAALNNTLHIFPKSTNVGGIPTKEMKKIYTYRMLNKMQGGRPYYNAILSSAPYGKCPLCNHRVATTLDHHLAKADYPDLIVTPINLIPACKDCNTIKDTYSPGTADKETLHPYFDNIEDRQWLFASVNETQSVAINFFVSPPEGWTVLLGNRTINHFSTFEIEKLYSSHAGEELLNIRYQLQKLFDSSGPDGVKEHLHENYLSRYANNKNSWQTAMYKALSDSDWFCNSGFNLENI